MGYNEVGAPANHEVQYDHFPQTLSPKAASPRNSFVFPDPPEIPEDKMTNFDHLAANGNVRYLAIHLGNPDTTLVAGQRYLALAPTRNLAGIRYPDLLVAFDVDPIAYHRRRAYVISEQGKPPDFVMEIASPSTGRIDATAKRNDYAALAIPEYWRFDEDGRSHGARLAGDRLVDDGYQPIPIQQIANDILQGYSPALNLNLRWERGELIWFDPADPPAYHHPRGRAGGSYPGRASRR